MMLAGKRCECNFIYNTPKRFRQECLCSIIISKKQKKSILSELYGIHSIGGGILSYITPQDANNLRLICKEFKNITSKFNWKNEVQFDDMNKFYKFHACYPNALNIILNDGDVPIYQKKHANEQYNIYELSKFKPPRYLDEKKIIKNFKISIIIYNREQFNDMIENCQSYMNHIHVRIKPNEFNSYKNFNNDDFKHLLKIKSLDISYILYITDKVFQYLPNLENLEMTWGDDYISGKGFKYLTNLKNLCIDKCKARVHRNALKYCSNAKIIYSINENNEVEDGDSDEDIEVD